MPLDCARADNKKDCSGKQEIAPEKTMTKTFYSNGKLLLTGEYVVLDGAKALALPTIFGQNLVVENGKNREIIWKSFDSDGSVWFEDVIAFDKIVDGKSEEEESVRNTLIEILHQAYLVNPEFIENADGYSVTTNLTFPKIWGLGTSSTLINNIAQWTNVDAFELLNNSFGGSGYDIASAQNDVPIIYKLDDDKPVVEHADFNPPFAEQLYFVYLNRKQSSKTAIKSYYNNRRYGLEKNIIEINQITNLVLCATDAATFSNLLEKHETIMSNLLEMETVKQTLFSDFNGTVKSLGGWGGDFVLAVSKENPTAYFKKKGFTTIIPYREMILK